MQIDERFGFLPNWARKRKVQAAVAVGCGLAALAGALEGCSQGQTAPPSPSDISNNIQYFYLQNVKTPAGKPVECVEYGAGTHDTQQSKSWFGFACDFAGVAKFPTADTLPTQ